ncbi:MAG: hypothetical protein ACLQGP_36230 [Isosphaeraceae bacterium]
MLQVVRHLVVAFGIVYFFSGVARADALYSVTNLGAANPSGNYLGALSQSDQAAFQTGSFDVYVHPSTTNLHGVGFSHRGMDTTFMITPCSITP